LFGYFRDCMVAAVGCPVDTFLYASPSSSRDVAEAGKRLGLQTILAAMQILDQSLSRLRFSTQSRILAELALVKICYLEELDELANWITQLQSGQPVAAVAGPTRPTLTPPAAVPMQKKNSEVTEGGRRKAEDEDDAAPAGAAGVVLTAVNAADVWERALERVRGTIVDHARQCCKVDLAGIDRLAVFFSAATGSLPRSLCQRPPQVAAFEQALAEVVGRPVRVEFKLAETASDESAAATRPIVPPHQRILEATKNPMVRRAGELFGAQPTGVEEG